MTKGDSKPRCPTGLGAPARAEWRRQVVAIEGRGMDPGEFISALEQYVRELDLVNQIEREWIDKGKPLTTTATAGQTYQHPLLKMLGEHRKVLAQLADRIGASPRAARTAQPAKAPGRPKGSPSLGGIKKSSSQAKLRALEGGGAS